MNGAAPAPDRFDRLIERLPAAARRASRWLRRPSSRWARVPAGLLLIAGGLLFFLPVLGIWMLPLGLFMLAEDVPVLRRTRERALDRIERYRPHWFALPAANTDEPLPAREGRDRADAASKADKQEWAG